MSQSGAAANNMTVALGGLPLRLAQQGLIDQAQAIEAKTKAKQQKVSLVNYIVTHELASARDVAVAASHEFGVPVLDLDGIQLEMDVFKLVNQDTIQKHQILPLAKRGKRLFVGISDPTQLQAIDDVKFQTGLSVEAVIVELDKLKRYITKAGEELDQSDLGNFGDDDFDLENLDVDGDDPNNTQQEDDSDDISDAPVVRFVNKILLDAIKRGASDIHFEPFEKQYRVRTRLDGILKEVALPPVQLSQKISARLKVMSRLDIAERRVPQDGRIKMRLSKNRSIDFRVNTCPTLFGEKIVLRILDPSSAQLGIEVLGYEDFQQKLYLDALSKPYGMILVTGPTGSGKTVSLYTGLNILNTEDRNISTAEDPAEINVPGINQVNVAPKVGLTFASALKAFLRQDPDIIMVGEIRDLETAEIAIKAAQTGHLVLSTLHTNDAPKTLSRMIDMGVKPYAIASSITLIIAQRLARRLCGECKAPIEIPREALEKEGFHDEDFEKGFTVYAPKGCDRCVSGYKGRVGIYQVMPITDTISRIILEGGNSTQIADQAEKENVWDLRRSGLEKVKQGMTSLEEINRVTVD